MAFPNPENSNTHTIGDKTWVHDGEKWVLQAIEDLFEFSKQDPIFVVKQDNTVTYGIDPSVLEEIFAS